MKKIIYFIKQSPISWIILFYSLIFIVLRGKLLFTPDYTSTDAFHFNTSLKYYLWESLQNNTLPFWTNKLQGGMPIFAEGQIGALFLPNLFFLKFFSFIDGYNLLFIFSLFLLTLGFYLLLRELRIHTGLSVLISFIFTFNGAISFRWVHLNLIQSFSLTPLLFLFTLKFFKTKKNINGFAVSFIICQMIFAGHYQVVFIVLFSLLMWYVSLNFHKPFKIIIKEVCILLFYILSGFIFSLPQLIPTYKLSLLSLRNLDSSYQYAVQLPLTWKHLISFFFPFPMGNPKFATYPKMSTEWGIFWENSPFLGYLSLPFFCFSIFSFFTKKLYKKALFYYLVIAFILLLLSLGKDSPLYIVFAIFPFNIFRVPSKYLLMVNFFLLIYSALILQLYLVKKKLIKLIIFLLLTVNLFSIFYTVYNYHIFVNSSSLLDKPEFTKSISNKDIVLSFNVANPWIRLFVNKGWYIKDDLTKYIFMKNSLYPNSNLIYHIKNFSINTGGLKLNRQSLINYLLISEINEKENNIYMVSPLFLKIAPVFNITKVLSSVKIQNLTLIKQINNKDKSVSYFLYSVPYSHILDVYIPKNVISNIAQNENSTFNIQNLSNNSVFVENFSSINENYINNNIKIISNKEEQLHVTGYFKKDTFIVFKRNWYPEWELLIDNKKSNIYRSNLIYIGALIPKGEHIIKLQYKAMYFNTGLVSALSYLFILAIIFLFKKLFKKQSKV